MHTDQRTPTHSFTISIIIVWRQKQYAIGTHEQKVAVNKNDECVSFSLVVVILRNFYNFGIVFFGLTENNEMFFFLSHFWMPHTHTENIPQR